MRCNNNPINFIDPSGNQAFAEYVTNALKGAGAGFVMGGVFDVASQMIFLDRSLAEIDLGSVFRSAIAGAAAGMVGGAVGTGGITLFGKGLFGTVLTGMISGALEGQVARSTTNLLLGKSVFEDWSIRNLITDSVVGGLTAGFFYGTAKVITKFRNYISIKGYGGRLEKVNAIVSPQDIGTGTYTNSSSRNLAQRLGQVGDDAGHALGRLLGGGGGVKSNNIFPQSSTINRGAYRLFERRIANIIRTTGEIAEVQIVFKYPTNTSTRPSSIEYTAIIGKLKLFQRFMNP